jgi:hypothetical protein
MLFSELYETRQVNELDLNKMGRGIGRAVGGASQAIGAAAGGIAGIPGAVRRGYQAGKNIVGQGIPDTQPATARPTVAAQPVAGKSTGAASTYSTITNPETGQLYTKAELRAKYSGAQSTTPTKAIAQPNAIPGTTATTPADAVAKMTAKQAKKDIDNTITAINQMKPRSKNSTLNYGQKAFTKAVDILATTPEATPAVTPNYGTQTGANAKVTYKQPTGIPGTTTPQPANAIGPNTPGVTVTTPPASSTVVAPATKTAKISAAPSGGAPTADERAKLDQRIQAALAKQAVAESLKWSKTFDPSQTLMKQIHRS